MAKSLKSISDKKKGTNTPVQEQIPDNVEIPDEINSVIDRYSGKSEAELMQELKKVTAQQKSSGTFDRSSMLETMQKLSPMLNDEQRRKLKQITDQLL